MKKGGIWLPLASIVQTIVLISPCCRELVEPACQFSMADITFPGF